jgi:hypothetical protein
MKAYQYSILRYRRSKSAGELVNIGLIMAVPEDQRVLHFITPRYARLSQFFGDFESSGYRTMVDDLKRHFKEVLRPEEGPRDEARQLDLGEYVVTRDYEHPELEPLRPKLVDGAESCFQWSDVMSGIHPKPEKRFEELRMEFITQHEPGQDARAREDEDAIQRYLASHLRSTEWASQIEFQRRLTGKHGTQHVFLAAWENGKTQVLDAVSFDYLEKTSIERKANRWCGTLHNLSTDGEDFEFTGVVAPPPQRDLFGAFDNALKLIGDMEQTRDLIRNNELEKLDRELAADLG